MLSAGQALWRVGARSFVVQHYRSRIEARLTEHRHRDERLTATGACGG